MNLIYESCAQKYMTSEDAADRLLEPGHVPVHGVPCTSAVTVAYRFQQVAVLAHCVVEPGHPVEREEPDAQREDVVLVQRLLQERVVRAAVDVAMEALVEVDERPLAELLARRRSAPRAARRSAPGHPRSPARRPRQRHGSRALRVPRRALRDRRRRPARRTSRAADIRRRAFRGRGPAAPLAPGSCRARAVA